MRKYNQCINISTYREMTAKNQYSQWNLIAYSARWGGSSSTFLSSSFSLGSFKTKSTKRKLKSSDQQPYSNYSISQAIAKLIPLKLFTLSFFKIMRDLCIYKHNFKIFMRKSMMSVSLRIYIPFLNNVPVLSFENHCS